MKKLEVLTVAGAFVLTACVVFSQPPRFTRGPLPHPVLQIFDRDNDRVISQAELSESADALKRLDRDGDGKITFDELVALMPQRKPGPGQRFAAEAVVPEANSLPCDDGEKRILELLADLEKQRRGMGNVPREDGRLLRLLTEAIGAKKVVEIGTSNGYSGLWFCLALRRTGGHLITHEIDEYCAGLAKKNFERAGVSDSVTIVLGDAHETVTRVEEPVDFVFIDADKEGYPDYLKKLLPKVRAGGLIVAHNMRFPSPAPEYIEAITTDPSLETLFLHMNGPGVAVTLKKR